MKIDLLSHQFAHPADFIFFQDGDDDVLLRLDHLVEVAVRDLDHGRETFVVNPVSQVVQSRKVQLNHVWFCGRFLRFQWQSVFQGHRIAGLVHVELTVLVDEDRRCRWN